MNLVILHTLTLEKENKMGMREFPQSGYVIPVSKFLSQEVIDECDYDNDMMSDKLQEAKPELFAGGVDIYIPGDEDTVDEPMEKGIPYIWFDVSQLFEMTPNAFMKALEAADAKPALGSWSVWG